VVTARGPPPSRRGGGGGRSYFEDCARGCLGVGAAWVLGFLCAASCTQ